MGLRSFQWRVALWSALTAGAALAAFAAASYWLIRDSRIARLDTELRGELLRELSRPRPPMHWIQFEAGLAPVLGLVRREGAPAAVLVSVHDAAGNLVYASPGLAASLGPVPMAGAGKPGVPGLPQPGPGPFTGGMGGMGGAPKGPPGGKGADFDPPEGGPPFGKAPPDGYRGAGKWDEPPGGKDGKDRPGFRPPPPLPGDEGPRAKGGGPGVVRIETREVRGVSYRVASLANPTVSVSAGVHLGGIDADLSGVRNAFLLAIPAALALIVLGAWWLAARALAPVRRLTAEIREVNSSGLDRRVDERGADREFAELISTFNAMLERLGRSFAQASRFSADAAHELRTPLTILQGELEQALHAAAEGSPAQRSLARLLDETRRMGAIVQKLLLLAQADAGRLPLHREAVDVGRLLASAREDLELIAPEMRIETDAPAGLQLHADPDLVAQVLLNLLSNAVKYNADPRAGWIRIAAKREAHGVSLLVANGSNGLGEGMRERLFERFFRADAARNRGVDGTGLGLALAREIARAHGGDLVLAEAGDGRIAFRLYIADPAA